MLCLRSLTFPFSWSWISDYYMSNSHIKKVFFSWLFKHFYDPNDFPLPHHLHCMIKIRSFGGYLINSVMTWMIYWSTDNSFLIRREIINSIIWWNFCSSVKLPSTGFSMFILQINIWLSNSSPFCPLLEQLKDMSFVAAQGTSDVFRCQIFNLILIDSWLVR